MEIQEIKSEEFQSNSQAHKKYKEGTLQQHSAFLNSLNSNVEINNCKFSLLKANQLVQFPLLINSQSSKIHLNSIQVLDCIFHYNLIVVTDSSILNIKDTKFINLNSNINHNIILKDSQSVKQFSSLIEVINSNLEVQESQFSKISCSNNCYGGVFRIIDGQISLNQLEISEVKVKNLILKKYGYEEGALYIYGIKGDSTINNVQFINCSSNQNGGALSLNSKTENEFKFTMKDCKFQNNISSNGRGGAIYIKSDVSYSKNQNIIILNSQFNKNEAMIGGALYIRDMYYDFSTDSKFIDNRGYLFGNDQVSYPTKLFLVNLQQILSENYAKEFKEIGDYIEIFDFRSGDVLRTMQFQLRNDQNIVFKPASEDELSKQNVYVKISPNNLNTKNYNIRGNLTSLYNKDNKLYSFEDLIIVGTPGQSVLIEFKSDQIYNLNKNTNLYEQNYSFIVKINFRECTNGEQIKEYNDLVECDICKPGLYSYDQKQCSECPSGVTCNGGVDVVTNYGYWRNTNVSILIENCYNLLENCVGGSYGDNICYEGHIGALCEECDIYGIQWGYSYTKSAKYSCTKCDEIKNNIWIVVLMTLWTQISMTLAIKGDIEMLREKAAALTLKKNIKKKSVINSNTQSIYRASISSIQRSLTIQTSNNLKPDINDDEDQIDQFEDKSGIYIKLLTNYIQIVGQIASFNLNIPSGNVFLKLKIKYA